ncbi:MULTISPECIES: BrnA antitoxin family protein [Rhodopseudomonas]|uniref:BrnA antitoxin family protein n=1 Tax=Rhodopseudomonas palustris TaxID=1076 RepID=A0A0D7ES04_RHOPL|nr:MULTISPECIES: BrnA antitoxin family protein [Rhodopseudomonas]KIZ43456.1 hypothetical protein OO17_11200 [Rhodopseudomonas palustris]MDF3809209.1 BrnA antitoxin family protein [Rhodopseudomonas sp. BAL398]WOK19107.1 BrnA antitoxin family protein [Rhodopseudomonas sp. BAL398]
MPRKIKEPVFDDDNPEWTEADFAKATRLDGIKAKDLTPEILARIPGSRGPQKAPTKVAVSIRLSPEVIAFFKAKGPGWQSRIDDALPKIAKVKAS